MGAISTLGRMYLRFAQTLGIPATQPNQPDKRDGIAVFDAIDAKFSLTDAALAAADVGITPFQTKALMDASSLVNGDWAQVLADGTGSNNGFWEKVAGTWTLRVAYSLPGLIVRQDQSDAARAATARAQFAGPDKVVWVGDSMVQSGCGVSGSTAYYAAASGSQMARRLYPYFNGMNFYDTNDPRGLNFSGANYGVSGYKTADVDGLVAAAIAQGPSIVGYAAGINDLLHTADSAATIMGRIQTSVRKFTRLGIRVLLANIRPIGTSGDLGLPADDATVRPRLATLNGLIATFCSTEPLVVLADLYAELDNGSGQLASADGADGVHVSVSGAVKESRGWIKALRKIDRRVAWTPNIYEGNALPNFDMRQTGGTAGTGASGSVVPAGFRILRTSGGSSTVITNVITSELDAREKELLIRITPDTSADYETFSFDKSDFDLAPLANKWAIAYARVDVEADVQLRNLRFGIAGFSHDFLGTPATDLLPTGGYQFELMTPPFKVGSSPGTALFHLQPTIKGTGFGGTYMDIKLYRMGVMPIPVDPDWHRNLIQGS